MTDVDGLNAGFARDLLEEYLENPDAVPSEWRELFESGNSDVVATHPGLVRLLELAGNGHAVTAAPAPAPSDAPNPAIAAAYDDGRLRILRSLERGDIDVAEAGQRLEALDDVDPLSDSETIGGDEPISDASGDVDPGTETARFDPNATTDA